MKIPEWIEPLPEFRVTGAAVSKTVVIFDPERCKWCHVLASTIEDIHELLALTESAVGYRHIVFDLIDEDGQSVAVLNRSEFNPPELLARYNL